MLFPISVFKTFLFCCRSQKGDGADEGREDEQDDENVLPDDAFREMEKGYNHNGGWVEMDKPRACSYSKYYGGSDETVILGDKITPEKTSDGASVIPMPVEMRGITLRQLRAIHANAVRRCVEESWVDRDGRPITPETVNLYDIDKYIIRPFTKISQASLVETLPCTEGTQPPRFFVSHWWGESFRHTLACIELLVNDFKWNHHENQDVRGGGMTEDTPLWICAFANNQWDLNQAVTADPMDSSFVRAMKIAQFRTLSILDAKGVVFSRIWCILELFLTLVFSKGQTGSDGVWAVYTAHKHTYREYSFSEPEERNAAGIVSGGVPGEDAYATSRREQFFPSDLILRSLDIKVESAEASVESDRIHILNSIIGNIHDLNAVPPAKNMKYDELNDAVKGAFAASIPALKATLASGGEEDWKRMLVTLSKGVQTTIFRIDFGYFHESLLPSTRARELVSHIPITCRGLKVAHARGKTSEGVIEGMIVWVEEAKELEDLTCHFCRVGDAKRGREAGRRLADVLSANHAGSMKSLSISGTDLIDSENVAHWASAFRKMKKLEELYFIACRLSDEDKDILREASHGSNITF